jgi:HSP20 family protein
MQIRKLMPWGTSCQPVLVRREAVPFRSTAESVERLFEELGRDFLGASPWTGAPAGAFVPRIDMAQTQDLLRVEAELPGLEEKDVEISLSDDVLVLRGEKKAEQRSEKDGWQRFERSFGSFERAFELPFEVDAERASARFKSGVLVIELPKAASARERVRKIEIRSSN